MNIEQIISNCHRGVRVNVDNQEAGSQLMEQVYEYASSLWIDVECEVFYDDSDQWVLWVLAIG